MYKVINDHIHDRDINSALSECISCNFNDLGLLLGNIEGNGNKEFYNLITILLSSDTMEVPRKMVKYVKVKLLCNWTSSEDLAKLWNKMSKGNFTWDNIKIVWDEEPDYFVVLNCPPINEFPPANKTIVFQMEPLMDQNIGMWGDWAIPDPTKFVWVGSHKNHYNNNEWHLSKTYTELKDSHPDKDPELKNVISTVLSAKYKDPGHIKRIDFVKFLEKKGVPVHVYGDNKWEYKDYRGALPYHAKDNALMTYRYTFNVENHSLKNYYTEKLIDGILSECLVFYSGCYNIREFLPKDSFVYLELSNFEQDYNTIKKAIEENWWEQRLPAIREAKRIILEESQFFPRLHGIITSHKNKIENEALLSV